MWSRWSMSTLDVSAFFDYCCRFPDLWGMLVLGALNVLAIPILVPYALSIARQYLQHTIATETPPTWLCAVLCSKLCGVSNHIRRLPGCCYPLCRECTDLYGMQREIWRWTEGFHLPTHLPSVHGNSVSRASPSLRREYRRQCSSNLMSSQQILAMKICPR